MTRRPGLLGFLSVSTPAVLSALLTAVLGVLTARYLGAAGQGALTTISTVSAILSVVLTLGTGVSVRLRAQPDPRQADVAAYLGASVFMGLAAALLAPLMCLAFDLDEVGPAQLALTALLSGFLVLARQSSDLLQAYGRTGRSILFLALGVLVQCSLFGLAVVAGRPSLGAALGCVVIGAVAQISLAAWDLKDRSIPRPDLDWPVVRSLIRVGVPSVAYSVGLLVTQRLDRLVIVGVLGSAAGGVYAVAATMAEASRITSSAVGQLLFVQTAAGGRVTSTSHRTYGLAVLIQALVVVVGWFLAPSVVPLIFGDAYVGAAPLAQLLLIAEMFMGLALMDGRLLMGLHRVSVVALVTAGLVVLSVPTYVLLVRASNLQGAARASLLLYLLYAGALLAVRIRAQRKVLDRAISV